MVAAALLATALVAPAPPVSVGDILGVTDISAPTVSPDGKWVVFRASRPVLDLNAYRSDWYAEPLDRNAPPRRIADAGGMLFDDSGAPAAETPVWSPDSNTVYFRALVDGEIQIWRVAIQGGEPARLTQDAANVRNISLSPDGRSICYHVGAARDQVAAAERDAHDRGVLVDATVNPAQPISKGSIVDGMPASQRLTPGWFTHAGILWQAPLLEKSLPLDVSARPTRADFTTEIQDDGQIVAHLADGDTILCDATICTSRSMSAVPVPGSENAVITTADDVHDETVNLWSPRQHSIRTIARADGVLNGGRDPTSSCGVGAKMLICVAASALAPPRLVAISIRSGGIRTLYDPNKDLRDRISATARIERWTTTDGTGMTGILLLPSQPRPTAGYPLVITYYSCWEFLRGGVGDELPMLPLADHGVATLCINAPRSKDGDTGLKAWAYDHATDGIRRIVDRLSEDGQIDRHHVGIWGLSFGSEIAMIASWRLPWLAAASISTGTLDPDFYWFNAVAGRDTPDQMRKLWQVGAPDSDPQGWQRFSPALNADKIHMPLLLQQSEEEARWSMQLYSKLSRSRTPVEMYAFANEPHVKNQPRHKLAAYERNLAWFLFWLKGERVATPVDPLQYVRWARLLARSKSVDRSDP